MKAILIIDDDLRNTFALSAVLKAKGFTTFTAHNMAEVFAVLQSEKQIGIILLDIMMPVMDGYEAVPVLKSNGGLPVIAITAQAMPGDKEKCLDAGADNYLSKPVDVDALIAELNKYLK